LLSRRALLRATISKFMDQPLLILQFVARRSDGSKKRTLRFGQLKTFCTCSVVAQKKGGPTSCFSDCTPASTWRPSCKLPSLGDLIWSQQHPTEQTTLWALKVAHLLPLLQILSSERLSLKWLHILYGRLNLPGAPCHKTSCG
jgi:hypothetical protein